LRPRKQAKRGTILTLEHRNAGSYGDDGKPDESEALTLWSKPKLVEICVGLEISAYYPAEL